MITSILQGHGCYLGCDRINSLYENVGIREHILKAYLNGLGADPLGQDKLPDTNHLPVMHGLRGSMYYYFGNKQPPYAYKDAKLTLVWPVFHAAFPEAKWVLVRREKTQIVESCLRTPFMHKRKTRRDWERWVDEHEQRFVQMRTALDLFEVWTDRIVEEPEAFASVAEFCGLKFDLSVTKGAIKSKLWHRS